MTNTSKPRKLSAQAIFNKSASHLLAQGKQSYSTRTGMCAYRGDDGAKDAIGCLISDDEYSETMETLDVGILAEDGMLPERLLPHVKLLVALQVAHDMSCGDDGTLVTEPGDAFRREVALELRAVAKQFNLSIAVIEKFGH